MTAVPSLIVVPVRRMPAKPFPHLDIDDPAYFFNPTMYLSMALAYDSLAAPGYTAPAEYAAGDANYSDMCPRLAESWEQVSETTWSVRLRSCVSNRGNQLSSDDVVWAFKRTNAQSGTPTGWRWSQIVGLEEVAATGPKTVEYRLRAPLPTFPNWLFSTMPNIVDSHWLGQYATNVDPWAAERLNSGVAGYGPYNLVSVDEDRLSFVPRRDYWDPDAVAEAAVDVRPITTRAEAFDMLNGPLPTLIVGPTIDELASARHQPNLRVDSVWGGHVAIDIDFTVPPFDNVRVRQALAMATPYDDIRSAGMLGLARKWQSPLRRVSQGYDASYWTHATDPAAARKLLTDAGLQDGFSCALHIRRGPSWQRVGEIIRAAWAKVGVDLTLRPLSELGVDEMPPLYLRTECAHNLAEPLYDIAHDYAIIDPLFPEPGVSSGVGPWRPRWRRNDAAIDLLREVIDARSDARKKSGIADLQRYLAAFCSSIPVAETMHGIISNRGVDERLLSARSRFFQAVQYQNCTSNYLPS